MSAQYFQRSVSCIVRTAGERTKHDCIRLLKNETGGSGSVITVGGKPFPETLADSLSAGINGGRKWTLCVDADVLPFSGSVNALIEVAEQMDVSVIEIQGLVFDRFFGGWRPAGIHLYRTCHLEHAIKIAKNFKNTIRPESSILNRLKDEGLEWQQIELGFGLHDFMQHSQDIYRKCFLHAWKHVNLIPRMIDYWRLRSSEYDFHIALKGLAAGIAHNGKIELDNRAKCYQLTVEKKNVDVPTKLSQTTDDLLHNEERLIRSLGYAHAPVWDWAERHWFDKRRNRSLSVCIAQLVEHGFRSLTTRGDTTVSQRKLDAVFADWGILSKDFEGPVARWTFDDALLVQFNGGRQERITPDVKVDLQNDYDAASIRTVDRLADSGVNEILIYGAGEIGQLLYNRAVCKGITVLAFLETHPARNYLSDCHSEVMAVENGLRRYPTANLVVASLGSPHILTKNVLRAERNSKRRIWVVR